MSWFFNNKTIVLLKDFEHLEIRKFKVNSNKITLRGFLTLRKVGLETNIEDLEVIANGKLLPAEKMSSFLIEFQSDSHKKLTLYVYPKGYFENRVKMMKENYKQAKSYEEAAKLYMDMFNRIAKDMELLNKPKISNCKNCGAPLHGNRCEYCDTEY